MWITPKIDWKATDYFNIQDYNRIKNNLNHLKDIAAELYKIHSFVDMGADKTYSDYYYADEINLFESNLENINTNTFPRNIGDTATFYDNQPFIDYIELNRIEAAIRLIYNGLYGQLIGRRRLKFRLGKRRAV